MIVGRGREGKDAEKRVHNEVMKKEERANTVRGTL